MKACKRRTARMLIAAMLIGLLSACGTGNGTGSANPAQDDPSVSELQNDGTRESAQHDLADATTITLSGADAAVDGTGAEADGGVVTITEGGIYAVSGTLSDGRIIVDAPDADVTVALNGASISCSYGSPLYIYDASTATVHLVENTENTLTDGAGYTFADRFSSAADEEPDACLYSKADLVIEGAGRLIVTGNYNNGITSKDTLEIYDAAVSVTAVNHGVNGKDANTIRAATLTVVSGGDAVRASNDADATLGWVSITDAVLNLTAGEDGIQAETALTITGGSCSIVSGGGSTVQPDETLSAKGIKAGTTLTLNGGDYVLDCSDDAIHSNGSVTVTDGTFTVSSGDDALHADAALTVSGGTIDILIAYEGLEGATVSVSGGIVSIVCTDDGINAAGGADASGFGGFGPDNAFADGDDSYWIDISGGSLRIQAGGDGIDSNGSITLSGGTLLVSSTGQDDGSIDYGTSFTLSGGTLLAIGVGFMSQSPSELSQCAVSIGFDTTLSAGTYVSLSGGTQDFVFCLPDGASNLLFSSSALTSGDTVTVSYGGDYSGTADGWICSGGTYSGGTELTELTLEDGLTTYGSAGFGGGFGEGGRFGGGRGTDGGASPGDAARPEENPGGSLSTGDLPDDVSQENRPADFVPEDSGATGNAGPAAQASGAQG